MIINNQNKQQKYSLFSIIKNSFSNHQNWNKAWRNPSPKKNYDAVIVGGGGHGLASAYYLASIHGIKNIAVIEKGWIGGGNTGRNTTIIRSNYLWDESAAIYEHSLKLWEGLGYYRRARNLLASLADSSSNIIACSSFFLTLVSGIVFII